MDNLWIWLVVFRLPLWKYEFVNWDDYSQYMENMFQTTNQLSKMHPRRINQFVRNSANPRAGTQFISYHSCADLYTELWKPKRSPSNYNPWKLPSMALVLWWLCIDIHSQRSSPTQNWWSHPNRHGQVPRYPSQGISSRCSQVWAADWFGFARKGTVAPYPWLNHNFP